MAQWNSRVLTPEEVAELPQPIAKISVLWYSLTPGDAEVQIQWPPAGQVGMAGSAAVQQNLVSMTLTEITKSASLLGG